MDIKTIGVVGAGTMGSGIAQVFAQAGFTVRLVDVADPLLDRARLGVERSLDTFVGKGKLSSADRDATLDRLTTATAIDRLVEADYIVEAIVENAEASAPFTSSMHRAPQSSSHRIPRISTGAATKRPERSRHAFHNPSR
jgi:3-hydroxybutyryl-CoA dehydrogenase